MVKKFNTNTSAFSIAHYILLFLVVGLCIGVVAWVMIKNNNPVPENNVTPTVVYMKNTDPCVQRVQDLVARMWAYDPDMVPQKYWDIATDYLNQTITTRTYGVCQDVAFVCRVGQVRSDCDPCAVPSARDYARSIHVADMIKQNCGGNINTDAQGPVRVP